MIDKGGGGNPKLLISSTGSLTKQYYDAGDYLDYSGTWEITITNIYSSTLYIGYIQFFSGNKLVALCTTGNGYIDIPSNYSIKFNSNGNVTHYSSSGIPFSFSGLFLFDNGDNVETLSASDYWKSMYIVVGWVYSSSGPSSSDPYYHTETYISSALEHFVYAPVPKNFNTVSLTKNKFYNNEKFRLSYVSSIYVDYYKKLANTYLRTDSISPSNCSYYFISDDTNIDAIDYHLSTNSSSETKQLKIKFGDLVYTKTLTVYGITNVAVNDNGQQNYKLDTFMQDIPTTATLTYGNAEQLNATITWDSQTIDTVGAHVLTGTYKYIYNNDETDYISDFITKTYNAVYTTDRIFKNQAQIQNNYKLTGLVGQNVSIIGQTVKIIKNDDTEYTGTISPDSYTNKFTLVGTNTYGEIETITCSIDRTGYTIPSSPTSVLYTITAISSNKDSNVSNEGIGLSISCVPRTLQNNLYIDTTNATKMSYFIGETLDTDGIVFKYIISVNDNGTVHNEYEDLNVNDTAVFSIINNSSNDLVFRNVNNNSVFVELNRTIDGETVTTQYKGTYQITLNEIELSSIALKSGVVIPNFIETQKFSIPNFALTLTYNNETTSEVTNADLYYLTGSGEDAVEVPLTANTSLTTAMNGKSIIAKYGGKQATIGTLNVAEKTLTSITLTTSENFKIAYTTGDYFDYKGLTINAHFNQTDVGGVLTGGMTDSIEPNNNSVSYYLVYDNVESASPISITKQFNENDTTYSDSLNLRVKYTYGNTTQISDCNITVTKFSFTGNNAYLGIDSSNAKIEFTRNVDNYDASNIKVYAVRKLDNGSEYKVRLNENNNVGLTITHDLLVVNSKITCAVSVQTISISASYNGNSKTGTYDVAVVSDSSINNIFVETTDGYDNYIVGELFSLKNVVVKANTSIGTIEVVKDITITDLPIGTPLNIIGKREVTISYTRGSVTKTTTITINVYLSTDTAYEDKEYKIAFNVSEIIKSDYQNDNGRIVFYDSTSRYRYPLFESSKVDLDTNSLNETYNKNIYIGSNESEDCIGYIDVGKQAVNGITINNGTLVLFDDYINPIDGNGNIVVKFPHYVSGYSDKINKCKFGRIFNKRLFVSGNSDAKNYDWHTSSVANGDSQLADPFTYFSDLDYCIYGSDDSEIVGYDIYRDGNLIVVKTGSRNEATLYRREANYITATDYTGTQISGQIEESYPCFDINTNGGEGGLNYKTITNFLGTTLILTKSGIKALTTNEKVNNSEKFANDCSTYINYMIKNEELENALLYSFKERLYLKTSRGLYVGEYEQRNENNEYEWYFLDIKDIDNLFEYDDMLYFTRKESEDTLNGSGIYRLLNETEEYSDKERVYLNVGSFALMTNSTKDYTDSIVYNEYYDKFIKSNNKFNILTKYDDLGNIDLRSVMHGNLGTFISEVYRSNMGYPKSNYAGIFYKDNTLNKWIIELNNITNPLFYEDEIVYFDDLTRMQPDSSIPNVNIPYKLKEISNNKFYLVDEYGTELSLSTLQLGRLSYRINDKTLSIIKTVNTSTDVDNATSGVQHSFSLSTVNNQPIDIIKYNGNDLYTSAVVTIPENINSYYETMPYNFGSMLYEKTIWGWTIANDSNLASYMKTGFMTSRKQGNVFESGGARQVEFDNFDFGALHFTNDKLPHVYSKYRTLPNIMFIRFIFKNEEESNMVIGELSMFYSISQLTKGVK